MPLLHLLALLASPPAMAAEVTGQIRGEAVDADGIPVPGVTITAIGPSVAGAPSTTTDEDGRFFFAALPPGEYIVTASKGSFLPYKATGILVVTGASAYLKIEMKLALGSEEILVEDVRPAVDTQRVATGAVLSRESMRDIPNAGRDYQSLTGLAPGVVGSGNAHVQGGFDNGNQFYIDGVNNTDPITGTFSQNMNYDAIEEVQVVTGGMDAEYGKALGGAINIVTRSGSNEFGADVQILFADASLQAYKPLEGETKDDNFQNASLAINFGGPIVKDRLWYFVSLEGGSYVKAAAIDASIERPDDVPMEPRDYKSIYYFGKLTWAPNGANRLSLQFQGDPTRITNIEQNPYTLPEGETAQAQGGYSLSAGHILTQGDKGVLQSQLYYQKSYIKFFSMECLGSDDIAECIRTLPDPWLGSYPEDFNGGQFPYGELSYRYRASVNTSYTRFFDALGRHQFKVGLSGERLAMDDIFPGATYIPYYTNSGDPTDLDSYVPDVLYAYDNEFEAHLVGYLVSAYAQDVYNPIDRLTIRPGVRFDYALLKNDVGETAFAKGTVAPRLGAAFDLTNDGKTSLHAAYGRFYDTGFLMVSDLLHQSAQGYAAYSWNEDTGDWGTTPIFQVGSSNLVYDQLKNPWSDKVNFGFARDLGQGWGFDTTFTYSYSQNFWEDDEVNLIWNAEGTDVIGYRNGVNEALYRIRTPDEAFNTYTDVEVSLNRQFSDNFAVMANYTWARSYGTNSDQFATGVFDNPEQAEYEEGLLAHDRTHTLKILGSMRQPDAVSISDAVKLGYLYGWNYYIASGFPYRPVYYDQYYQGWDLYQSSMDGSYRLPAESQLDLKLGVTVAVRKATFDLTVECFNVFNDRAVQAVDTTYGNETGDGVYVDENGDILFGQPLTRQDPRYFQFGLRGEF